MLTRKDRQIQMEDNDALRNGITTTNNTDVMKKSVYFVSNKVNFKEGEVNLIGSLKEAEYNKIHLEKMVIEGKRYNPLVIARRNYSCCKYLRSINQHARKCMETTQEER